MKREYWLFCFMAFSDWEFLLLRFKNICCWKSDCDKHYCLSKYLSNFREPQVEQPKHLLHLKKWLTIKFLRLSVQFGLLELISHNPCFSNNSFKKDAGMKLRIHFWLHIWQHNYFPFFSKFLFQIIFILSYYFFYLFRLYTVIVSFLNSSKTVFWFINLPHMWLYINFFFSTWKTYSRLCLQVCLNVHQIWFETIQDFK